MVSNLQTEYPAKTLAVNVGPSLYAIFTYERRIGASHSDARTSRRLADADWLERRRPSVSTARRDAQRPDTARRGRSQSFVPFRLRSFPPLAFSCDSSTRTVCPPRRTTSGCSLSPLSLSISHFPSLFLSFASTTRVFLFMVFFAEGEERDGGRRTRNKGRKMNKDECNSCESPGIQHNRQHPKKSSFFMLDFVVNCYFNVALQGKKKKKKKKEISGVTGSSQAFHLHALLFQTIFRKFMFEECFIQSDLCNRKHHISLLIASREEC